MNLAALVPRTLFGRTAAALLAAFAVLQAMALAVVWVTVIEPLAARSADELAARMVLAAQTWVELPPPTRTDYELELSFRHDLEIGAVTERLPRAEAPSFFGKRLEAALAARARQPVELKQGADPAWSWVELEMGGRLLRIGFRKERYQIKAPLAATGILLAGALLTLLVALLLVGRTSRRLERLADLAREVGQGRWPEPLPETGAEELVELTRAFNRMASEVQGLLENRTTLLAGISHDLRTPLTRLRLALSMLEGADRRLIARMEADLVEIDRLLAAMLGFARALQVEERRPMDLNVLLSELVEASRAPHRIEWQPVVPCVVTIAELALRRIVGNLLENALRYGAGQPVQLRLVCTGAEAAIEVSDRGPGIPEAEREAVFRPFYRLETSRSQEGGGSGLGLAIARQLALAHGWRIELLPREGGGLTARVVIPRETAR